MNLLSESLEWKGRRHVKTIIQLCKPAIIATTKKIGVTVRFVDPLPCIWHEGVFL